MICTLVAMPRCRRRQFIAVPVYIVFVYVNVLAYVLLYDFRSLLNGPKYNYGIVSVEAVSFYAGLSTTARDPA